MQATALPLAQRQPVLEVKEPKRRPRYDRLIEPQPRLPFARARQIETEARRIVIDVRNISTTCQGIEVGILDEDIGPKVLAHLDADPIDPAEG